MVEVRVARRSLLRSPKGVRLARAFSNSVSLRTNHRRILVRVGKSSRLRTRLRKFGHCPVDASGVPVSFVEVLTVYPVLPLPSDGRLLLRCFVALVCAVASISCHILYGVQCG